MPRDPNGGALKDGESKTSASSTDAASSRTVSGTRPAVRMKPSEQPTRRVAPFVLEQLAGAPPSEDAQDERATLPAPEPTSEDVIAPLSSVSRVLVIDLPSSPPPPRVHDPSARTVPAAQISADGGDLVLPTAPAPRDVAPARVVAAPPHTTPRVASRPRRALRAAVAGLVLGVVAVAAAVVVAERVPAVRARLHPTAAPARVVTPVTPVVKVRPLAPETEPGPTPAAEPPPSAPSTIPADMGRLETKNMAAGRRVFVDDRAVAQTPESVLVKCGQHAVQVGSSGKRQIYDVPCGQALPLRDR